jgi:hypothetical protein
MTIQPSGRNLIADFVQNVQDAFTVLALTDREVARLMEDQPRQVPRPLVFEILTRQETADRPGVGEAVFVPHISRRLSNFKNPTDRERALKLLSENSELIVDRTRLRPSWKALAAHNIDLERMAQDPRTEKLLAGLLGLYRDELIPTNTAASALVHQAWKQGLLHRAPEKVRDAFFLEAKDRPHFVEDLLERMAEVVLDSPLSPGGGLPDGRRWQISADNTRPSAIA